MIKLLSLVLIGFVKSTVTKQDCSNDFREITVKENLNSPYQMSIDYETNNLFFSETVDDDENESSKVSYLNLQNGEYARIPGIAGGFATAVDSKNHIVYLGGKDGIFKYDFEGKNAFYDGARNISMWQLFFKNTLYFTTYPEEIAYKYTNQNYERVSHLENTRTMLIGVSNNNNIYFSNSSGLFYFEEKKEKIHGLGEYTINSFTSDKDGDLYFSTPTSIYYIDDVEKKTIKIILLPNIYGFVMEYDYNIIYAQEDKLVRLKFVNSTCIAYWKNKI